MRITGRSPLEEPILSHFSVCNLSVFMFCLSLLPIINLSRRGANPPHAMECGALGMFEPGVLREPATMYSLLRHPEAAERSPVQVFDVFAGASIDGERAVIT